MLDVLILTAVLGAALLWPLHSPPIAAHGEAREGLVVQDIVHNGHWVLPRRNGELPSKPPLFHWTGAAIAGLLGLSDATVRAPSALAAWLVVLTTYGLGVAVAGRTAGWFAAGVLLGMPDYWAEATNARVDMVFTACVTISLAAFLHWYRQRSSGARLLCYLATALAVLAKGPAGVALPLLVIVVFVATERDLGVLRELWSWRLAVMAAGLDLGWYLLAFLDGGREFLVLQLLHENVDRFVGSGGFGEQGGRGRFFMLGTFLTNLLPWNLVLAWAAVRWMRGEREDAAGRFLHVWWGTVLAFFSLAFGKRGIYLLPLYPAIALLAARALALACERAPDADRAFGLVRAPRAIGRLFRGRAVLATATLALVILDLVILLVGQGVREHRANKESLVEFAAATGRLVSDGPLLASADLAGTDLQVIAYRLQRPIPRVREPLPVATCGDPVRCLVPVEQSDVWRERGYRPVLASHRGKANLMLVMAPAVGCDEPASGAEAAPLALPAPAAK